MRPCRQVFLVVAILAMAMLIVVMMEDDMSSDDMSALGEVRVKEKMVVVLDDTSAYYDDDYYYNDEGYSILHASSTNTSSTDASSMDASSTETSSISWSKYSLGDVVKGYSKGYDKNYYRKEFPASLAVEFLDILDKMEKDGKGLSGDERLLTFCQLVSVRSKKGGYAVPEKQAAVIHLRLSDAFDYPVRVGGGKRPVLKHQSGADAWMHGGKRTSSNGQSYIYAREYYEKVASSLPPTVESVVLVGSGKHKASKESMIASKDFIALAASFFRDLGFDTTVRLSEGTPDEDFIYLSNARVFVYGGGGYSKNAGICVTQFGGITKGGDMA